jgi:hypothetical protein
MLEYIDATLPVQNNHLLCELKAQDRRRSPSSSNVNNIAVISRVPNCFPKKHIQTMGDKYPEFQTVFQKPKTASTTQERKL